MIFENRCGPELIFIRKGRGQFLNKRLVCFILIIIIIADCFLQSML